MSEITVKHVEFLGNWEALYIDGELIYENHNIGIGDLSDHIEGETIKEVTSVWKSFNLSEHFGASAPESYEELESVE